MEKDNISNSGLSQELALDHLQTVIWRRNSAVIDYKHAQMQENGKNVFQPAAEPWSWKFYGPNSMGHAERCSLAVRSSRDLAVYLRHVPERSRCTDASIKLMINVGACGCTSNRTAVDALLKCTPEIVLKVQQLMRYHQKVLSESWM